MTDRQTDSAKPFRLSNQFLLLTYKSHLDKLAFREWFETNWPNRVANLFIAHESGDEDDPYLHSHISIAFTKAFQSRNARVFDFQNIHPHIKILPSRKAFEDSLIYITKEDITAVPPNIIQLMNDNLVTRIHRADDLLDAMTKNCRRPSDALGIATIFGLKQRELKRFSWQPYSDFHHFVLDLNDTEPDTRSVYWFYDPIGNTGKTKLSKYLRVNFPQHWFITKDMGTSRDAATIITNALHAGWNQHGIIIDLPRCAENHNRMYQYIEEITDGLVTSQKYNGRSEVFDSPHVVIFANWLPKTESLSKDRWNHIYQIKPDGSLLQLTLNMVEAIKGSPTYNQNNH